MTWHAATKRSDRFPETETQTPNTQRNKGNHSRSGPFCLSIGSRFSEKRGKSKSREVLDTTPCLPRMPRQCTSLCGSEGQKQDEKGMCDPLCVLQSVATAGCPGLSPRVHQKWPRERCSWNSSACCLPSEVAGRTHVHEASRSCCSALRRQEHQRNMVMIARMICDAIRRG